MFKFHKTAPKVNNVRNLLDKAGVFGEPFVKAMGVGAALGTVAIIGKVLIDRHDQKLREQVFNDFVDMFSAPDEDPVSTPAPEAPASTPVPEAAPEAAPPEAAPEAPAPTSAPEKEESVTP